LFIDADVEQRLLNVGGIPDGVPATIVIEIHIDIEPALQPFTREVYVAIQVSRLICVRKRLALTEKTNPGGT